MIQKQSVAKRKGRANLVLPFLDQSGAFDKLKGSFDQVSSTRSVGMSLARRFNAGIMFQLALVA
jgi:hypothetical protein